MNDPYAAPNGEPGRMPRWLRWGWGAAGIIGAIVLAFMLWIAAAMSGGLDDLLDMSSPAPEDGDVRRARERAIASAAAEVRAVEAHLVAAGAGAIVGRGAGEECHVGQHNWKIDDSYDLRCTAREVLACTAGDPQSLRTVLHGLLVANGWTHSYGPPAAEPASALGHQHSAGYSAAAARSRSATAHSCRTRRHG